MKVSNEQTVSRPANNGGSPSGNKMAQAGRYILSNVTVLLKALLPWSAVHSFLLLPVDIKRFIYPFSATRVSIGIRQMTVITQCIDMGL